MCLGLSKPSKMSLGVCFRPGQVALAACEGSGVHTLPPQIQAWGNNTGGDRWPHHGNRLSRM